MPYLKRLDRSKKTMENDSSFSIENVYDLAIDIGNEFEKIIRTYGPEEVNSLINKIIKALERLETQVQERDRMDAKMSDLKLRLEQLENANDGRTEGQQRFIMELEQIEEQWSKETNQLSDQVKKLQDENKRLMKDRKEGNNSCESCALQIEATSLVESLQFAVNKLQLQLKHRERELKGASESIEMSQGQLKQMNNLLQDQVKQLQSQIHLLVDEKSSLQVQLTRLTALQKCWSESHNSEEETFTEEKPKEALVSITEFKKVIFERNELLNKVKDLKDELASVKSSDSLSIPEEIQQQPCGSLSSSETGSYIDLPVEGPINREPFEKLYPGQKVGGMRKFFRFLLGRKPTHFEPYT